VFDTIASNIAIRDFRNEPIKNEHLLRILDSARLCQSGKNLQPWYFIVIRNREALDTIASYMKDDVDEIIIRRAPTAIAIVSNPSSEFHIVDCGRAAQNMTLAAWELGIGSCFISGLEPPYRDVCRNRVKRFLQVRKELNLIDLITFGYLKRQPTVRKKNRKSLEEIAFEDTFGRKLTLRG
jgi:nitroreductase